jgi:tetratricopeptide (TPR) repeat protein
MAQPAFQLAQESQPASADIELARLLEAGKLSEAASICGQLIEADADNPLPYLCLAKLWMAAGNHQKASEFAAEAIVRKPDWGAAYLQLGLSSRELGQQQLATRAFEMAIACNAADPETRLTLADLYYEQGMLEQARAAYTESLQSSPGCPRSTAMLRLLGVDPDTVPIRTTGAAAATPKTGIDRSAWRHARIVIVAPEGYSHWQAFAEFALGLKSAFTRLGSVSEIVHNETSPHGVNLILGAHLIKDPEQARSLPDNLVIFNLEQIDGVGIERMPAYKELLARKVVWDYSPRNIARIRELTGNSAVHRLAIGYDESLACIPASASQSTDVLFYGSLNARRAAIIDQLRASGLRVRHLFNVYGSDRDFAIANAKIVLNMHFYADSIHEIVRTSFLLSNSKAVVSECNANTEVDDDIREAICAVPYEQLHDACLQLARDNAARSELERRGHEIFTRRNQSELLRETIEATTPSSC